MTEKRTRWNSTIPAGGKPLRRNAKPLSRGGPLPRKGKPKRVNAKRKGHRFPKYVLPKFREWIRTQECALGRRLPWWTGIPCTGRIECDHVKTRGAGGADERNCIPLCAFHHRLRHDIGIKTFERDFNMDTKALAAAYWQGFLDEFPEEAEG